MNSLQFGVAQAMQNLSHVLREAIVNAALSLWGIALLISVSTTVVGSEAPIGTTQFNVYCPSKLIAPELDHAYHECRNGIVRSDYDGCGIC